MSGVFNADRSNKYAPESPPKRDQKIAQRSPPLFTNPPKLAACLEKSPRLRQGFPELAGEQTGRGSACHPHPISTAHLYSFRTMWFHSYASPPMPSPFHSIVLTLFPFGKMRKLPRTSFHLPLCDGNSPPLPFIK